MKVLLGTTNHSNQPIILQEHLREIGVEADHLFCNWQHNTLTPIPYDGYSYDQIYEGNRYNWYNGQIRTLERVLNSGYDVFHFWNRPILHEPGNIGFICGQDIPIIKATGSSVVYRFTGYDARLLSKDIQLNPYSPHRNGFRSIYNEDGLIDYHNYLRSFCDAFLVTDPEMQAFFPEAEIIPRGLNLAKFQYVGIDRSRKPLVVHAPSNKGQKGSDYIVSAVENLKDQGLSFDFKLIHRMRHEEAVSWYRRADIVIDQILGGWYGVLSCEAMALGKPVIVYVRDDLESYFDNELPFLNANPSNIQSALERLIKDYSLRKNLSRIGHRFVRETHDAKKVANMHLELYKRVHKSKRKIHNINLDHLANNCQYFDNGYEYTKIATNKGIENVRISSVITSYLASSKPKEVPMNPSLRYLILTARAYAISTIKTRAPFIVRIRHAFIRAKQRLRKSTP